MSRYCRIHGEYSDWYHGCPDCREAEERAEKRAREAEEREEERAQEAEERAREAEYRYANPGDYKCPACKYITLKRGASACPKCRHIVAQRYWDDVAKAEAKAAEEWKRAEPQRRAAATSAAAVRRKDDLEGYWVGFWVLYALWFLPLVAISIYMARNRTPWRGVFFCFDSRC
jgi:ribosomal protein L37AE/L43A